MEQTSLFEPEEIKPVKIEPGRRCRDCIHCYEHEYNSTKYCDARKGVGTSYGHKKIKALAPACPLFEKITK